MKVLELFAGSRSVGKIAEELGMEVFSSDLTPFDGIHYAVSILDFDVTKVPFQPDVIWASPDCTTWSLATGGKYRSKIEIYGKQNERYEKSVIGNKMVCRVIEILKYFKPKSWFIENPRGLMCHFPPLIDFIKETEAVRTLVYYGNYNTYVL